MFQKVLVAEDKDFINSGIKSELKKIKIHHIENIQYCDEALLKLKRGHLDKAPFDLLISDLSFEEDYHQQDIKSGLELIKRVREEFPELKIIVFSIEDKSYTIQSLFKNYGINGYVWKSRDGLRELKQAINVVFDSEKKYISPRVVPAISKNSAIEITEFDVFILECLSQGYQQEQISEMLKKKKMSPTSISAIEKRLKILKEQFNANNPTHLISIAKDLGLV